MDINSLQGLIYNDLKFLRRIGKGSFGIVYQAQHIENKKHFGVKVEQNNTLNPQLNFQIDLYRYFQKEIKKKKLNHQLLPKVYGFFTEKKFTFLVMELYGKNVNTAFKQNQKRLDHNLIIKYSKQMLKTLQFIHQMNIVHRDIKPQNFVFQKDQQKQKILLLDFGLCKKITKKNQQIPNKEVNGPIGTARYASINAHEGKILTRRDDLQSLAYVVIYLMKAKLPWQGIRRKCVKETNQEILKLKRTISVHELCEQLPSGIINFLSQIKKMTFYQLPDYEHLHQCLDSCLRELAQNKQGIFNVVKQKSLTQIIKKRSSKPQQESRSQKSESKYSLLELNDTQSGTTCQRKSNRNRRYNFKNKSFIIEENQQYEAESSESQTQQNLLNTKSFLL